MKISNERRKPAPFLHGHGVHPMCFFRLLLVESLEWEFERNGLNMNLKLRKFVGMLDTRRDGRRRLGVEN